MELNNLEQRLTVHYDRKPIYDIVFNDSFSSLMTELYNMNIEHRRVCIVTESNVANYYLAEISDLLFGHCKLLISFVFPEGELSKNLNVVQDLYAQLIQNKFDRKDLLIALGGGVVGDLTGFAAATFLRGIDFIQIPTSLLAQVDSSIGGKTGVDFQQYKNMVGAFHQPQLVYVNISTLQTLSERQFNSGMGEIIKHSLIKDSEYYEWLVQNSNNIRTRSKEYLTDMIIRSCNIKRLVVEDDPSEKGDRALLNFGHTLGHAIEKLMNFKLYHGECVAIGCLLSNFISFQMGLISKEDIYNIKSLFDQYNFPAISTKLNVDDIIQATKNDKKMQSGHIKFILLRKIGEAYIDETVTDKQMRDAIEALYALYK